MRGISNPEMCSFIVEGVYLDNLVTVLLSFNIPGPNLTQLYAIQRLFLWISPEHHYLDMQRIERLILIFPS